LARVALYNFPLPLPFSPTPSDIPDARIEGIWRQIIDVFRGGILADWFVPFRSGDVLSWRGLHYCLCSSVADSFSLEVQESEENFDLALIGALEIDVIPQLGDLRIPDSLVIQLAKVLRYGSRLHDSEEDHSINSNAPSHHRSQESHDFETVDLHEYGIGSTVSSSSLPRERFSYWCFDLLFLVCSNTAKGILKLL
jgi:hypothetical protein